MAKSAEPPDLVELFRLYCRLEDQARALIQRCEKLRDHGKIAEARKLFDRLERVVARMQAMENR